MEIYDQKKICELTKDFYNLVGLKVCIYDNNEEELAFYPEKLSSFCAVLREDKEMDKRCRECDCCAFAECKRTRKQYVYTCHAGLLECMSPIVFDKKIIGYLVLGQIKAGEDTDFDKIAHRLPVDKIERLRKEYDSLASIEVDKLRSAMRILDACTGYEYLKALVGRSENKVDVMLADYINDNLGGELSVPGLCSKFHLAHSEIYAIFKRCFNATPAEYIKARRLEKACELLKNTDMPINKIGSKCGFPDYNYFSKVFKKEKGTNPRAYRRSSEFE